MHAKHLRRKLVTLGIIAVAMLATGIGTGMRRSSASPQIDFFDIDAQNFVAETHGMKRMEVWSVPEGSRGEEDWNTIGLMRRSSHWFSWSQWSLAIPKEPVTAYQIMVRGYDEEGTEMDRVTLPWIGGETIKKEVWKIE